MKDIKQALIEIHVISEESDNISFDEYLNYLKQYWTIYPIPKPSSFEEDYKDIKL